MDFIFVFFFFFQAEDGIRDGTVTGVQTCALPICAGNPARGKPRRDREMAERTISKTDARESTRFVGRIVRDRKSTRLNSSHSSISYAVFCLKKKKKKQ